MINTKIANDAIYQVETLPDGTMGDLSIVTNPVVECQRIVVDDGLIARSLLESEEIEWKGQMIKGDQEIVFAIVAGKYHSSALRAAYCSPILCALWEAGWILHSVWRVEGDEF